MKSGLVGLAWLVMVTGASAQIAAPNAPVPPASPPTVREPGGAGTARQAPSEAEIRDLVESGRATAKATREAVDYARVVPDILQQILAKLDKIEDKLDKVEEAVKAGPRSRR